MEIWNRLKTPPAWALKKITGGRLSGMTDISPLWRIQALTEQFGVCGVGWSFSIEDLWIEEGSEGQRVAFAKVNLYIKLEKNEKSMAIPGIGGSMLITKEKAGLHTSDEAYKMAVTDALGTAAKCLGLGADVYAGLMDSKYSPPAPATKTTTPPKKPEPSKYQLYLRNMAVIKDEIITLDGSDKAYYDCLKTFDFNKSDKVKDIEKAREIYATMVAYVKNRKSEIDKDNEIPY